MRRHNAGKHLCVGTQAEKLRDMLVAQLREAGMVRTPRVEAAMRAVPRHVFLPGVPLRQCYANDVTATKRDSHGVPISAASQPSIVGLMLEQLDVRPGMRILEIGAGTGYNAALLSHLTGPGGLVVTVDVDDDIVAGAQSALAAAHAGTGTGTGKVTVLRGDGAFGAPGFAPFDRIIATAGVWDLPPAWAQQLSPGGLIVVPLRLRGGVTRSVALERPPAAPSAAPASQPQPQSQSPSQDVVVLRSRSSVMCGFMPLRASIASDPRRTIELTPSGDVALEVQQDQDADPARLAGVLDTERVTVRTGVALDGPASAEAMYLWLTCSLPGGLYGMTVRQDATVAPMFRWGTMAAVAGGSLAYLTSGPAEPGSGDSGSGSDRGSGSGDGDGDGDSAEIRVTGHGPDGPALAKAVAEQVRVWSRDYRTSSPEFTILPLRGPGLDPDTGPGLDPGPGPGPGPGDSPTAVDPGTSLIRTPHNLITVTWRPRALSSPAS